MLSLFLAFALAAATPGELKTYGDWVVGCDNVRACEAIALRPEQSGDGWLTLSLERGAGAEAAVRLKLGNADATPAGLFVDGRRVAVRFIARDEGHGIVAAEPAALTDLLRNGAALRLTGRSGAALGKVSLKGAAAAMRYMDEQQGRAGSTSALVARGPRNGLARSPTPPPKVRIAPAANGRAIALSPGRAAALRREARCEIEEVGGPEWMEAFPLASGRTLILLACGSGAYNVTHLAYIAAMEAGRLTIKLAPFDALTPQDEAGRPSLVNAFWDEKARRLSDYPRARGLGDCGTRSTYGWDGARFRLLERETMGECRGSIDYIRIWQAEAVGG